MQAHEVVVAERWLAVTLTGDAVLAGMGVYSRKRKAGTSLPAVVFINRPARDFGTVSDIRIWAEMEYIVKAICAGSSVAPIADAAKRIDALLHGASGDVYDQSTPTPLLIGRVEECVRVGPLYYDENTEDKEYRHLGGIYRVRARAY